MRARVVNGHWVLDAPTDVPEGTVVEIVTRVVPASSSEGVAVYLDERLREYIHALLVRTGRADPRYEDELAMDAKMRAQRASRAYTTPEDIQSAAREMLPRFVAASEDVQKILDEVPVP